MFYGLAAEKIPSGAWRFEHILQDIQTLNDRALRAELDVTAISLHAYPRVARHYAITHCGASVGDGYGPIVVAREPMDISSLRERTIAVPGELTTAFLALNLLLGKGTFRHIVIPFDRILEAVVEQRVDAGLIIHEGQLTFAAQRLTQVVDLGQWWKKQTGLPLPLGVNVIRRSLGLEAMQQITGLLRQSIEYGLSHREAALRHALKYARDLEQPLADRFVSMYVNDFTLDLGSEGRRAVKELLARGHRSGLMERVEQVDIIDSAEKRSPAMGS